MYYVGNGQISVIPPRVALEGYQGWREFLPPNTQENIPGLEVPHATNANSAQTLARAILGTNPHFIVHNFLSSQWTWEIIKARPEKLPCVYLLGMIGYTISLPIRISIFVFTFLKIVTTFFVSLLSGECAAIPSRLAYRGIVFLGATGELVSAAIGVVCPPIAYKFDELIQTNPQIHSWYAPVFSLWYHEIETIQVRDFMGPSNQERLQLKQERVADKLHCFMKAKEELTKYCSKDEIDGELEILSSTMYLGMVHALEQGYSLKVFRDETLDKCDQNIKEAKKKKFDQLIADYEKYWKAMVNTDTGFMEKIPLLGRFFSSEEAQDNFDKKLTPKQMICAIMYELLLERGDLALKEGERTSRQLREKLQILDKTSIVVDGGRISRREAVKKMFGDIKNFADDVMSTDREMFIAVTQKVFSE